MRSPSRRSSASGRATSNAVVNPSSALFPTPTLSSLAGHEPAGAPSASRSYFALQSRMTRAGGLLGSTSLAYGSPASRAIPSARLRIPDARAGPIAGARWAPPDRNEVTARKVRRPCVPARAAACSTALKPPSLPSMAQRMSAKLGAGLAGAARPSVCMLSVSGIGATRSYAARSRRAHAIVLSPRQGA